MVLLRQHNLHAHANDPILLGVNSMQASIRHERNPGENQSSLLWLFCCPVLADLAIACGVTCLSSAEIIGADRHTNYTTNCCYAMIFMHTDPKTNRCSHTRFRLFKWICQVLRVKVRLSEAGEPGVFTQQAHVIIDRCYWVTNYQISLSSSEPSAVILATGT